MFDLDNRNTRWGKIISLINNIVKLDIYTQNNKIRHIYYHIEKTTQNGLNAEITRRKYDRMVCAIGLSNDFGGGNIASKE